MARIRTVKPEFWQDEDVGSLPPEARLLFIAAWNIADDEGLLVWTPAFLRAQVFAYDDLALDDVRGLMDKIVKVGFIHPYAGPNGKKYGWVINFRKHQKIDKPQKPKHPVPSIQNAEVRRIYAHRDGWRCHLCGETIEATTSNRSKALSLDHVHPKSKGGTDNPSNIKVTHFGCNSSKKDAVLDDDSTTIPRTLGEHSPVEGKGREGIKDQGREQGAEGAQARPPKGTRLKADFELPDDWLLWAVNEAPAVNATAEAKKFVDYWVGVPGQKGLKLDWLATWRNWIRRTAEQQKGNGDGRSNSRRKRDTQREAAAELLADTSDDPPTALRDGGQNQGRVEDNP